MKAVISWLICVLSASVAFCEMSIDCDYPGGNVKVNKIDDGFIRPYVFLYGIGNIYPYLRTSSFLNRYEKYNRSSRYKIILFYPGDADGASFKLFGTLDDHHTYRAIVLMNE